ASPAHWKVLTRQILLLRPVFYGQRDRSFKDARLKQIFGKKEAPGPYTRSRRYASRSGGIGWSVCQHCDRAAVLVPARDIVADRHRTLLAVGNCGEPVLGNAAADQIVDHRRGAASAQSDVVFARAALVGMAFDDDAILRVLLQPLGLLVQSGLGVGG